MKQFFFAALFALLVVAAACSKSSVTPDAGSVVAGTYTILTDRLDTGAVNVYNDTYPLALQGGGTATGTLVARRDSASVVYITETFKATGYNDQNSTIGQVSLRSNGSSYDMYRQGFKIGTTDGTTLTIDYSGTQGGTAFRVQTTAKK